MNGPLAHLMHANGLASAIVLGLLVLAGCIPVPRQAPVTAPQAPPAVTVDDLYGRFHGLLDPLWAGINEGTMPSRDDIHAARSNFDAALMLDEDHPRLHAVYARLRDDLEDGDWTATQRGRSDLRGMIRTAKELLNRYYVHPTPGTWRHLLAERPEVTCLGQMGEGAVLLEVRGYPGGQQRRERAIVTLGEAFADGLRLVDIAEGKIILEYLPLMQEFEVPAPSN